jgi:hypothetical protein
VQGPDYWDRTFLGRGALMSDYSSKLEDFGTYYADWMANLRPG